MYGPSQGDSYVIGCVMILLVILSIFGVMEIIDIVKYVFSHLKWVDNPNL
jgi:threonine/homoserine/homoserine lactone efflux protein